MEHSVEKDVPLVTLSAAEKADLFNAACRAHSGPATFICRPCADAQDAVIERVIAARVRDALAEAKGDIRQRITTFRALDADPQYMNALHDAWGLVANRERRVTPPGEQQDGVRP